MVALHHEAANAAALAPPDALTHKDEAPGLAGDEGFQGQAGSNVADCAVPASARQRRLTAIAEALAPIGLGLVGTRCGLRILPTWMLSGIAGPTSPERADKPSHATLSQRRRGAA